MRESNFASECEYDWYIILCGIEQLNMNASFRFTRITAERIVQINRNIFFAFEIESNVRRRLVTIYCLCYWCWCCCCAPFHAKSTQYRCSCSGEPIMATLRTCTPTPAQQWWSRPKSYEITAKCTLHRQCFSRCLCFVLTFSKVVPPHFDHFAGIGETTSQHLPCSCSPFFLFVNLKVQDDDYDRLCDCSEPHLN